MKRKYHPKYNINREYENRINEFRIEKGLTLNELAKKIEITVSHLWRISQGYEAPAYKNGVIKNWVSLLCYHLGCYIEDLFPYDFCKITQTITDCQLSALSISDYSYSISNKDICYHYEKKEACFVLDKVLSTLTPNEKKIIKLKFIDDFNDTDISKIVGLSKARVGQIIAKAFRKLRHPTRIIKLSPIINFSAKKEVMPDDSTIIFPPSHSGGPGYMFGPNSGIK